VNTGIKNTYLQHKDYELARNQAAKFADQPVLDQFVAITMTKSSLPNNSADPSCSLLLCFPLLSSDSPQYRYTSRTCQCDTSALFEPFLPPSLSFYR
jgi:hypothetical protein